MPETDQERFERAVRMLPLIAAACLAVCAVVCSQTVAQWFDDRPPLAPPLIEAIQESQAAFLVAASVLLLFGLILRGCQTRRRILQRRSAQRIMLATLVTIIPLFVLEVGFRPIAVSRHCEIYTTDTLRGWKHRPNTMDYVVQCSVRINSIGLRGPELSRIKPLSTHRILFLGDSVVFGQGIASDDETIPEQVAARLGETSSRPVESINAGVCGYSPWQQHIYLEKEGLALSPDLVVSNFVLNDVTEKFNLPRFGGTQPNNELRWAATSTMPPWLARSGIYFIARGIAAHCRFGGTPRMTATRTEMLGVKTLCQYPDDPTVRYAWAVTLANLRKIVRTAESAGASNVLVVYPYAFQLEDTQAGVPQQVLAEFAREQGVTMLDLLPVFRSAMGRDGLSTDDLFLDFSHPTSLGARVAAEAIADVIDRHGLVLESATIVRAPSGEQR